MDLTGGEKPKLSTRLAAAWADLTVIPLLLGIVFGAVFAWMPEAPRGVLMMLMNISWLGFRDFYFAPGRNQKIRLIVNITGIVVGVLGLLFPVMLSNPAAAPLSVMGGFLLIGSIAFVIVDNKKDNFKLISLTGDKVTLMQALVRNLLLFVPFVIILGYPLELIMVITRGDRLADAWSKTKVVLN